MISFNPTNTPLVLNNHISVKAAALYSGYSPQYLNRMMRHGKLPAVKVGQLWLINKGCFDTYLENAKITNDGRFGPK